MKTETNSLPLLTFRSSAFLAMILFEHECQLHRTTCITVASNTSPLITSASNIFHDSRTSLLQAPPDKQFNLSCSARLPCLYFRRFSSSSRLSQTPHLISSTPSLSSKLPPKKTTPMTDSTNSAGSCVCRLPRFSINKCAFSCPFLGMESTNCEYGNRKTLLPNGRAGFPFLKAQQSLIP